VSAAVNSQNNNNQLGRGDVALATRDGMFLASFGGGGGLFWGVAPKLPVQRDHGKTPTAGTRILQRVNGNRTAQTNLTG
jgi:hypothetical protein